MSLRYGMEESWQGAWERLRRVASHRDTAPPAFEMLTLDDVVKIDPVNIANSSVGQ